MRYSLHIDANNFIIEISKMNVGKGYWECTDFVVRMISFPRIILRNRFHGSRHKKEIRLGIKATFVFVLVHKMARFAYVFVSVKVFIGLG